MDCYLIDRHWLSEVFEGVRICNFDIRPTNGTTISSYLGKVGNLQGSSARLVLPASLGKGRAWR